MYLLHSYVHKDQGTVELLRTHNIYSLLLVNVDGYAMISDIYDRENIFELIRKNRHPEGS